MKLSYWMIAKSIVVLVFGIGFVVLPGWLGSIFGLNLDAGGKLMAQLFGAAFIFECLVLWLARNSVASEALQAIIVGVVISNVIGFIVTLIATLNKVWSTLGWLPVALYLIFAAAFAYFLFSKPAPARKAAGRR